MTILLAIWIVCAGIGLTGIAMDKPITVKKDTRLIGTERHFYYTKKYYRVHKILEME